MFGKFVKISTISLVVLVFGSLSFNLMANPGDPLEIFKIAGNFAIATDYGKDSPEYTKLLDDGWEIQHISFGVDTSSINDLCYVNGLSNPLNKSFQRQSDISTAAESFSNLTGQKISSEKLVDICNNETSKYLNEAPPIEQHFVYNLAEKCINGKNYYVIDFRGTPDQYSWIFTDFMAYPIDFLDTGTKVHAGFEWNRQACMNVPALTDFIKKIENDISDPIVIVVGHSMGAAVATLETAYLLEKTSINPDNLYLISFAEPCPGKEDFGKRYESKMKHYYWPCNLYDIVPMMPMVVGFQHFNEKGLRMFDLGPVPTLIPYSNDRHNIKFYHDYALNPNSNSI